MSIEEKLGITFSNESLLESALTSKPFRNEARNRGVKLDLVDNEKLAFLGDAVLELVVRERMFRSIDDLTGVLSSEVDTVVDNHSLYLRALEVDLKSFMRLGAGESTDDAGEEKILSRGVESLIGALYLDQGLENTASFVFERLIV